MRRRHHHEVKHSSVYFPIGVNKLSSK
uniref:Uncharacterized protein n=1 Tax=Arundo donax TaxID=35708 RepID=A0A0A9FU89_ARUDO